MLPYRENRTRGTEDFPLSHYKFTSQNRVIAPHWHPEIEIIYMTSGEMTVNVSEEKHVLKQGDIFFVNPEELHTIIIGDPVEYYVVVFFPSLFQFKSIHFLERDFILPVINGELRFPRFVSKEQSEYHIIHPIVRRMFCENIASKALVYADLTALFCVMLENSMMVQIAQNGVGQRSDAVKRCIQYMEENYTQRITLGELASLVHMSSNYFCSYFKKHTGVSPITQLNYIRVKAASGILMKNEESVVNVAETCGFENVSFFIRKFKEITGYTPSVYRKRMK